MGRNDSGKLVVLLVTVATVLGGLLSQAFGQETVFLPGNASRCDIYRALSAYVPSECTMRPKTVIVHDEAKPSKPQRAYLFATRIQFAFDSHHLLPGTQQLLDSLAGVLNNSHMAQVIVRIEGHADSVGSADYNLDLSSRRALAVQQYLHTRHRIDTKRIPAIGKGEYDPIDPLRPRAAINRRVQFVNLSESREQG